MIDAYNMKFGDSSFDIRKVKEIFLKDCSGPERIKREDFGGKTAWFFGLVIPMLIAGTFRNELFTDTLSFMVVLLFCFSISFFIIAFFFRTKPQQAMMEIILIMEDGRAVIAGLFPEPEARTILKELEELIVKKRIDA